METATDFLKELDSNIDAWYANVINRKEFNKRNIATWDRIEAASMKEQILALIRERI